MRVLLIEDDPDCRTLAKRWLKESFPDLSVDEVTSQRELDLALEGEECAIVLTSCQVAWADGLAVSRACQARWPACAVLFLTGSPSETFPFNVETIGGFVEARPSGTAERFPSGMQAVLARAEDTILRRKAEAALQDTNEFNKQVFASAQEGIVVYDRELLYRAWNPAMEQMTGLRTDEVLGRHPWDVFPFIREQGLDRLLGQALGGLSVKVPDIPYAVPQTGKSGWASAQYAPYRNAKGEIIGVIATIRDITARKQAEEALDHLQRLQEQILHGVNEGIYGLDMHGRAIFVNRAAADMIGAAAHAILGQPVHMIVHHARPDGTPYPPRDCPILATLQDGEVRRVATEEFWRLDGTRFPVEYVSSPIRNPEGQIIGAVVTFRDITQRKRAEEELAASRERLRLLSRQLLAAQESERREIAINLHDEIGQVLTALKMNLQSVQRASAPTSESPQLRDSLDMVDQLMRHVRNLSLELRPSMLDDFGLTATLRWYLERQEQRAGWRLEFDADQDEEPGDGTIALACYRVAQEAVTNAMRHARATVLRVSLHRRDDWVELAIADNGAGFDVESAFTQASLGVSMGLLSMQERVRLVGGAIRIESAPGSGTTVRVRVPHGAARLSSALGRRGGAW